MAPTPLVSIAAHPLIDIDLTVVVQFVLFLLLFIACNALLFQPYLKLRARRTLKIDGARAEADQMSATAEAKLADYETKLASARATANEEGRKVRAEASAHEREVTEAARRTAQQATDEAQATMRRETDAARAQLMPQADALAKAMTSKLLGREVA